MQWQPHGMEHHNTARPQHHTSHQSQHSTQNRDHEAGQFQAQAIPGHPHDEEDQIVPHLPADSLTLAATTKASTQSGDNGGMRTAAHDDLLQHSPYAPDQASAPASRAPREP